MANTAVDKLTGAVVAFGLSGVAVVAGVLVGLPVALVAVVLSLDVVSTVALVLVVAELGFLVTGLGFVALTDRGWGYLDLRWPTRRDALVVAGGVVAALLVRTAGLVVARALGVPFVGRSAEVAGEGAAPLLLLLVPISLLVIGPSEELLFRNVIQKHLYDSFSRPGAVVVASVPFALVHAPNYIVIGSASGLVAGLVVVFGVSLVLGASYARTENLVVPTLVHGVYDVVIFGSAYLDVASIG